MTEETVLNGVKKKSEATINKEKKKLKAFLRAVIPESYDKYDLQAKFDSSLTYLENKEAVIEDIKVLDDYKGASLKEQAEVIQAQMEKINEERDEAIEKEIMDYNHKTYVDNKELDEFYKPIHRPIDKMCQGFSNLAFIKGRGGVGKSWNIRKILLKNKVKFLEVTGDVTEAYLYRLLFENNGTIFWFKDVVRILRGMNSINLLKAATETEKERLLTSNSYSKQQEDLPKRFLFKGKIIFDYNEIVGMSLKDDFEALQTRGDYVEAAYSMDDMKAIMNLVVTKDWQKEVTGYLIEHYEFTGQNLLNLRTQYRAFQTYLYCQKSGIDWKNELKEELKSSISKVRGMLYSLMGNKSMRTAELKKLILKYGIVNTMRTADNKVNDWILTEELFKWSEEERNYYVALIPPKLKRLDKT